jgi:protein-disulfide isomerase
VAVHFELFTSSFCGACAQTRAVLETATSVIPDSRLTEHDVAFEPDLAETVDIVSTPTVIVRDGEGREVVRATGVPTMDQVLRAAVLAVDSPA